MPPRLELLTKRWPTFDLPILPFLAPRVFQPWPPRGQKLHSASRRTQRQEAAIGRYRERAQDNSDTGLYQSETSSQQNWINEHRCSVSGSAQKHESTLEDAEPSGSRDSLQEDANGHYNDAVEVGDEDEFKSRYEEIWGVPLPEISMEAPKVQTPPKVRSQRSVFQEHGVRWEPVSLHMSNMNYGLYKHFQAAKERGQRSLYGYHALSQGTKYRKTKVIRIHPGPGQGSNYVCLYGSWHTRFAGMKLRDQSTATRLDRRRAGYNNSRHRPNFPRSKLLRAEIMEWIKHKSPSQLRSMWQEDFTETMRVKAWLELMITMLELHPTKALGVLDATFIKPYPPSYAVMDSLNYLIDHYFRNQQDYPSEYIDHLSETLFRILVEGPRKQLSLSQHSIKLVMSGLDHSQRERFYEVLVQIGHPMKENTLIHFSDQFARNGHTDLAFEVMQRLKNSTFNTPAMLSLCSTLLHRANRDPNALSTETAIFKFMVDCGMTPNVITHNILIRNAIEDGDHQTAWQIHDMMKDAGIEPDDFTYSILLNDAKKRMDATDIGRVMSIVREGRMRSPHIATDVLHAILLLYQKNVEEGLEDETGADSKTAFTHMLPVYCEYFQLKPLARIIHAFSKNYPEAAGLQLEAEQTFFPPSQEPLVIMITAYLSAIKDPRSARKFYDHFRTLVYAGNPAIQELVTTTRIWNFILFTFGRFPELMADCANLIGDMMSPVEKEILVTPESDVITHKKFVHRSFVPPKPDVYTWSILLKIFTDQNQTRAAEKVISMMEERDIKPNIITWNTLINSYAEMQDIDMAADTIGRLEDAGLTADSVTFRTIYKIHNRSAFMRTLQDRRRRSPPMWSTATEEQLKEDLEAHVQSESEAATQEDSLAREKLVNVNEDEDTQPQPGIQIRKVLSLNGSIGPSALQAALARK